MTIHTRLKRLEKVCQTADRASRLDWLTEEEWLTLFEEWGRQGYFDREPEFPIALACYRDALQRAAVQADPPFDPPVDFMLHLIDLPDLRLLNWRDTTRFPEVHAAWDWLAEMFRRVHDGIPPVTQAEFAELAAWFNGNEHRLYHESLGSELLDVGAGRKTTTTNIRYALSGGPRASGAGEVAEDVRQLIARHGKAKT